MSLLSGLVGELSSAAANPNQAAVMQGVMGLLNSPEVGGLPGLLQKFQQSGMEAHVASWVSTETNIPISAEQIQQVLGSAAVQQVAQGAGISQAEASAHIASLLPAIVNHLTPNGSVPPSNSLLELGLGFLKNA
jgi:uncharacterized protein YidB (DUF937 family)